jgi:GDP-L-fucose synthase
MPRRELMYVDDLARSCIFLMNLDAVRYGALLTDSAPPLINVGIGEDITIRELAETVTRILGFGGKLVFDTTKPDGTYRKRLDVSRIHGLGWRHTVSLEEWIRLTWDALRDSF